MMGSLRRAQPSSMAPPAALLLDQRRALLQRNGCFQVMGKLQRALAMASSATATSSCSYAGSRDLEQVEKSLSP